MAKYKKLKKTAKGLKVSEKELKRLKKASPRSRMYQKDGVKRTNMTDAKDKNRIKAYKSYLETDSNGVERWVSNLILLGNERGRFDYPTLRMKAQELYDYHNPDVCIIEKKASGQSLIQDLRRAGLPVLDYIPDRDKTARVYAATPMMEAGRVWLPKGHEWSDDLYSEAITFPNDYGNTLHERIMEFNSSR